MSKRDVNELRRKLNEDYQNLQSWRAVAGAWRISKGMAYRIAVQGYEPKSPEIRAALELPIPSARIIPVLGYIPEGAQVLIAVRCVECGQWFSPNHPRRRRCFVCSPYRGEHANGRAR